MKEKILGSIAVAFFAIGMVHSDEPLYQKYKEGSDFEVLEVLGSDISSGNVFLLTRNQPYNSDSELYEITHLGSDRSIKLLAAANEQIRIQRIGRKNEIYFIPILRRERVNAGLPGPYRLELYRFSVLDFSIQKLDFNLRGSNQDLLSVFALSHGIFVNYSKDRIESIDWYTYDGQLKKTWYPDFNPDKNPRILDVIGYQDTVFVLGKELGFNVEDPGIMQSIASLMKGYQETVWIYKIDLTDENPDFVLGETRIIDSAIDSGWFEGDFTTSLIYRIYALKPASLSGYILGIDPEIQFFRMGEQDRLWNKHIDVNKHIGSNSAFEFLELCEGKYLILENKASDSAVSAVRQFILSLPRRVVEKERIAIEGGARADFAGSFIHNFLVGILDDDVYLTANLTVLKKRDDSSGFIQSQGYEINHLMINSGCQ